jgi:hypothetical protein
VTHPDLPKSAERFPEWIQERVVERIAIMRDGNSIPESAPTPSAITTTAIQEGYALLYE